MLTSINNLDQLYLAQQGSNLNELNNFNEGTINTQKSIVDLEMTLTSLIN